MSLRLALVLLFAVVAAAPARAEPDLISGEEGWRPHVKQVVIDNWVGGGAATDALAAPMTVCQGTACATTSEVQLSEQQSESIRHLFADAAPDAATERRRMAAAIAQFETFVGSQNGTWRDHARNQKESEDEEGQMDCVSEATNTRSYLHRLVQAGLLTRHRIGAFATRYLVLLQHVAVEITEIDTGESFVVDSWEGENGEPPVIEPYGAWRMEFMV